MYGNPSPGPKAPDESENPDMSKQQVQQTPQDATNPQNQDQQKPSIDTMVQSVKQDTKMGRPKDDKSKPPKQPKQPMDLGPIKMGIAALAVIIIIASIAYFGYQAFLSGGRNATSTSTTSIGGHPTTTTVNGVNTANINSCMNITQPGTYYLTKNITAQTSSGPCINVKSSQVIIIGNGNGINGNGPFDLQAPPTYGIEVNRVTNVTIQNISITKFSYGVYMSNTSNSKVFYLTTQNMTLSAVALYNSNNNFISNSTLTGSESSNGALLIKGGTGNRVYSDVIRHNAFSGAVVNSTGNSFKGDVFQSNPVDMLCQLNGSFRVSNNFSNSKCGTNLFCNFASCAITNAPSNISTITLQSNVASCGTIKSPGNYVVVRNINTANFLNTSNPASATQPCIRINAPNVKLNCNGFSISNSTYGILIQKQFNISINRCNIANNVYGIYMNSSFNDQFGNMTFKGNTFGMFLNNSLTGKVSNSVLQNNVYGIYLNATSGFTFTGDNATGNAYGVYNNNDRSNVFSNSSLQNNVKSDLYCTLSAYNSSNLFANTKCGVTDCNWGSCSTHYLPVANQYPLSACKTINTRGNYTLNANIITTNTCFNIVTSNVHINCGGFMLRGNGNGSGFVIQNETNVTVNGCNINFFNTGINVSKSKFITLNKDNVGAANTSLAATHSSFLTITNFSSNSFTQSSYNFNWVVNSLVTKDTATDGLGTASAFVIMNSTNNIFSFDNATLNSGNGFQFANSVNNNIANDSAFSNGFYDYACAPDSAGLNSEQNGVNFGNTKSQCKWLVELNSLTLVPSCLSISSTSTILLASDILYRFGSTCYTVSDNPVSKGDNTVINCAGHTVLATNGGTFAENINASGVVIENCYIKNFKRAIADPAGGYQVGIYNNTITNANASIAVSNTTYVTIKNNTVINSGYGLVVQNDQYGSVSNNKFNNTNISMSFTGDTGLTINNNVANNGAVGMYMISTTLTTLQNSVLLGMSKNGIICTGSAVNATGSQNRDLGGNMCISDNSCQWMTTSSQCRPK